MTVFIELLFWIVVFVVLFFGFRHLQRRKQAAEDKARDTESSRDSGA